MQTSFDPFFVALRAAFAECEHHRICTTIIAEAQSVRRAAKDDRPLEEIILRVIQIRESLGEEVRSFRRVMEYL